MTRPDPTGMACIEFVELVTDYLEGSLPDDLRARFERHVGYCASCQGVLAQWREVVRLGGRIAEDDVDALDPAARGRLMAVFRERRSR